MVCNAIMSAGMAHMAELIEGGLSHRDAVAKVRRRDSRKSPGDSTNGLSQCRDLFWVFSTFMEVFGFYRVIPV